MTLVVIVERDDEVRLDNVTNVTKGAVYGTVVQVGKVDGGLHVEHTTAPVHILRPVGADTGQRFGVGSVVEVDGQRFLVQDHPLTGETVSPDGMTVRRQAPVRRMNRDGFGWLRQIEDRYAGDAAGRSLVAEHELARKLGFPTVLASDRGGTTTLVTAWPREPSGRLCDSLDFRLDGTPLPDGRLLGICAGLVGICAFLERLHAAGRAHRALAADVIIVRDDADWQLRDLGLAVEAPRPNETPDDRQAPEQRRRGTIPPGPGTDVYQVAAILYHVLTGRVPDAGTPLPVRAWRSNVPDDLASVVDRALATDPARRPDIRAFADLIDRARQRIH